MITLVYAINLAKCCLPTFFFKSSWVNNCSHKLFQPPTKSKYPTLIIGHDNTQFPFRLPLIYGAGHVALEKYKP